MDKTKPFQSVKTGADVLGVCLNGAYAAVNRGEIPTVKIGRRKLIPTAWLLRAAGLDVAEQDADAGKAA